MNEIDTVAQRRPSLVADAEIDRLVRQFASRTLFIRAAWHRGDDGAQNPLQAIEREARAASAAVALTPHGRALFMYLLPAEVKAFGDPKPAKPKLMNKSECQAAAFKAMSAGKIAPRDAQTIDTYLSMDRRIPDALMKALRAQHEGK